MKLNLRDARKKYRRMRTWRGFVLAGVVGLGLAAPSYFGLARTDSLICWLGAALFVLLGHLELRLKTIQVRLAAMDDELTVLRGKESDDANLILELSDW